MKKSKGCKPVSKDAKAEKAVVAKKPAPTRTGKKAPR